jgi:hypothetical protein
MRIMCRGETSSHEPFSTLSTTDSLDGAVETGDGKDVDGADSIARLTAWRARPWRLMDGAIGGVVISSRDISMERMPMKYVIEQGSGNDQQANEARMLHQQTQKALRTIVGFAELLSRTSLEPYQAKMMQSILAASQRLAEHIEFPAGERSTAIVQAGRGASDSPLSRALFAAARSITPLADARGLRLECRIDESEGTGANFDPNRTIEIVATLLIDAVFNDRDGTIGLCARTLSNGGIEIVVDRRARNGEIEENDFSQISAVAPFNSIIAALSAELGGSVEVGKWSDTICRTKFVINSVAAKNGVIVGRNAG